MSTQASELINQINLYLNNPAMLQQTILDFTRQATNGEYEYIDPTNPVVNTIESGILTSAATISSYQAVLRKQYPVLAQTWDDLFRHMSDTDYLNRFAVPAKTTFDLMFRKSEIINKMVYDPEVGYNKIVIPRNTFITVADTVFALEYPIEIRQPNHGGIQIVYNTDKASPIQELTSNLIEWDERQDASNNRFIHFSFETTQVSVNSKVYDLNSTSRFSTIIPITDNYYFARVFLKDDNGNWNEVYTTHSDVVYDANTFTATLQVTDQSVTVSVPEIYTVDATNNRKIRIDIYETKGEVALMLDNYPNSGFSIKWYAIDENEMNQFVAPLQTLETIIVYSSRPVVGGRRGLTFDELRDRVITNAIGSPLVPISNVQIKTSLEDENYEIVKNIDVITNRAYLASRNLPKPTNSKLITAANASIQTGLFSMEEALLVNTVIDNGNTITITPNTIFQNKNGRVTLLDSAIVTSLLALPSDQRALEVNKNNYYYTPFHYVLDATTEEFDVRPYYLDEPNITSKVFVAENDTTGIQVTINSYEITKLNTGYRVRIEVRSSDNFKEINDDQIYVQMKFKPHGESDFAFLNGTLIGFTENNERIYQFDIKTQFEVDKENSLKLTNFLLYTTDPKVLGTQLFEEFDVLFATTYPMDVTYRANSVDDALGKFILPSNISGISQERLRIQFGYYLDKLWARSRTVVTEAAYAKYSTDEIAIYSKDEYEINPDTGGTVFIENGQPVRHLIHAAGDPIVVNGETQYRHRKGDTILDEDGQPIIASPRKLYREIDYMLIESSYWFATDSVAISYRSEMTSIFVDWITNGLTNISKKLLEQTKIYFYPKTTTGNIEVMVKDGITTDIPAGQKFFLNLHVSSIVYKNIDLRDQLKIKTIEVINEELKKSVISVSQMTKALIDVYGTDVIDVEIEGLGGNENYSTLTVLHETDRPSIKKILKAQSDSSLIVEEAVELNFIKHELEDAV